jgi:hypothetical protein
MHLPEPFGQSPGWRGFRANTISIQILSAALQQPGWERQNQTYWGRMCEFLKPFYGDVRFVSGVEPHPVRAWFWRGFPSTEGVAAVIGDPYLDLWPECQGAPRAGDGLAYFGAETGGGAEDIFGAVGGLPVDLVNPNANYWSGELYPSRWPFDLPA